MNAVCEIQGSNLTADSLVYNSSNSNKLHIAPAFSQSGLNELWFYIPLDTKQVISQTFPRQSLGLVWKKLNLTQQKHAFINKRKEINYNAK